ncbi:hypothetical protein ACFFIX_21360 [Metabacillus herbersteinensis]|uniref:Uncharacterized protein n=1 Tax=Metabacillus herbersteinensis TaxID=283816 RepID=A0ABV6GJS7_9BACI
MEKPTEALLLSIALPGFWQLINGRLVKGTILLGLEFIVNIKANLNEVIISSFHGDIEKAIAHVNQWLMFYPCLYFFSMWDAFKDAGGGKDEFSFFPFVFAAFFVTVGCIYSSTIRLFGVILGPIWLPMLCVVPGILLGIIFMTTLKNFKDKNVF